MTDFQYSVAKIARFDRWLKAAFVAAGLPARFANWPDGYKSNLPKRDIRNAVLVAVACGECHAPDVFRDLVSAGSVVRIKLMADLVKNHRPVLDCILHHCPTAPVRAVLERLDFFSKLAVVAPRRASSLKLESSHFPDLGPLALKAATRDWGLFELALGIAASGQVESVLQNWSALRRLQNTLVQEPGMVRAMDGVTASRIAERATLCEIILPSFRVFMESNRRDGGPLVIPSPEILNRMCDVVADGRVVVRLLGRLVEAYGLEGIEYYVKAPNPAWLTQADRYLELLRVVPENLHATALDLAATVTELRELDRFVSLFKHLGGVAIPVIRALRSGHRFKSPQLSAIVKASEFGFEGAEFLDKLSVSQWELAARSLSVWREGAADLVAIRGYRDAPWMLPGGYTAASIIRASRRTLGIVRLGRLAEGNSEAGAVLDLLYRSLTNFYNPPSDTNKDVLVVVATRTDYNTAFREIRSTFEKLARNSHPVLIEGNSPDEIAQRITEMRAYHAKGGRDRLVSGVAFFGHGDANSLQISARNSFARDSQEALTEIGSHLSPAADVYLGACLVAHRGDGQDSFADTVAKAMPHCRVRGCPTVRYSQSLSWDKALGFVEGWSNHSMVKIGPSAKAQ